MIKELQVLISQVDDSQVEPVQAELEMYSKGIKCNFLAIAPLKNYQ